MPRHDAPRRTETGSASTRLIILRSNSDSGKSTIARAVRERYGYGCALVEQDYLRRIVLKERDVPGGVAPLLIEQTVRLALDHGYHVILDGILSTKRYADMLTALHRTHRGHTFVYYLDVTLDETLHRHTTRPQADQFTDDDMRSWYNPRDLLDVDDEHMIEQNSTLEQSIERIWTHLADAPRLVTLPIQTRL